MDTQLHYIFLKHMFLLCNCKIQSGETKFKIGSNYFQLPFVILLTQKSQITGNRVNVQVPILLH